MFTTQIKCINFTCMLIYNNGINFKVEYFKIESNVFRNRKNVDKLGEVYIISLYN